MITYRRINLAHFGPKEIVCIFAKNLLNMKKDFIIPLGITLERYMELSDLDGEVWKPVVGFERFFQISNLGRLKTTARPKVRERIKMPKNNGKGYWLHDFCIKNVHHYKYIHRLVAEAFLENPRNKPEVDHLNANRSDNRLVNLEWVSHLENQFNRFTIENREKNKHKIPIVQLSILGDYITTWDSTEQAARFLKISTSTIAAAVSRKRLSAKGYIFLKESEYNENKIDLPVAKSATITLESGIPSQKSVAVVIENRIVDAFPSDYIAAEFYRVNVSAIDTKCKRDSSGKYKKEEITMKFFKNLNNDERMTVRRILFSKRRIGE